MINLTVHFVFKFAKYLVYFLLFLLLLALLPYSTSNVYNFAQIKPFEGDILYNPYQNLRSGDSNWYKGNFHAHSKAWGGLTNGKLSPEGVYEAYKKLDYDIIVLSNYHLITKPPVPNSQFIPNYEHGLNVLKRHQNLIGAEYVVWKDYLLHQNLHNKQDMLENLRFTSPIVAINHPEFLTGYATEDFKFLSGYTHIEILNHYRTSVHHWDTALTAGYPAFGIGNDDSHNQTKPNETGRFWTMVAAKSLDKGDVLKSLLSGNNYSVIGNNGLMDNSLTCVKLVNDTMFINLKHKANKIYLITQYGFVTDSVINSDYAKFVFEKSYNYARIEVVNDSTKFFLNPIFRTTNGDIPVYSAEIDILNSIIYRGFHYLFFASLLYFTLFNLYSKRKLQVSNS